MVPTPTRPEPQLTTASYSPGGTWIEGLTSPSNVPSSSLAGRVAEVGSPFGPIAGEERVIEGVPGSEQERAITDPVVGSLPKRSSRFSEKGLPLGERLTSGRTFSVFSGPVKRVFSGPLSLTLPMHFTVRVFVPGWARSPT